MEGQPIVISISAQVERGVIGVEELESDIGFLNFFSDNVLLHKGHLFLQKNNFS